MFAARYFASAYWAPVYWVEATTGTAARDITVSVGGLTTRWTVGEICQ